MLSKPAPALRCKSCGPPKQSLGFSSAGARDPAKSTPYQVAAQRAPTDLAERPESIEPLARLRLLDRCLRHQPECINFRPCCSFFIAACAIRPSPSHHWPALQACHHPRNLSSSIVLFVQNLTGWQPSAHPRQQHRAFRPRPRFLRQRLPTNSPRPFAVLIAFARDS